MYFLFQKRRRRVVAAPPLWLQAASPSRGRLFQTCGRVRRISRPAAALTHHQ